MNHDDERLNGSRHHRENSYGSLDRGSNFAKEPQMPFIDEKLSNINDSRIQNFGKQKNKINDSDIMGIPPVV